jgi:hypothetical protein
VVERHPTPGKAPTTLKPKKDEGWSKGVVAFFVVVVCVGAVAALVGGFMFVRRSKPEKDETDRRIVISPTVIKRRASEKAGTEKDSSEFSFDNVMFSHATPGAASP